MRRHGSPQELERVRREAFALYSQGVPVEQIARGLDRSVHSVRAWITKARKHGVKGLAAKPHAGAAPRLTARQRRGLLRQLLKGAAAHGFDSDLWTAARVNQLIRQKYGVEYHVNYVPELLKALGFSRQRPERKAREQDEAEVDRWKRRDWPRIKKKRSGWAPSWCFGTKAAI